MPNITRAYNWAVNTCNKPNVGYSQPYRNQRTVNGITYYDCSSFIWYALLDGGFDVESAYRVAYGEAYTGNAIRTDGERAWLTALGFHEIDKSGEWKKGDICWRTGHTEMVYQGGVGQAITMGAHSSKPSLANQVSIYTTYSSNWDSVWRYGTGGLDTTSIYVISAICGNFWQESNINPALWEGTRTGSWTELNHGYGLGQWTNTGGDTQGRLYRVHEYLVNNGYAVDSGEGQLNYVILENVWYADSDYSYSSLTEFLQSQSTDITELTHAWNKCWEGIHDASWDTRVEYSNKCFQYISEHWNDNSITSWITGNRYLSEQEILNNAVMVYRWFNSYSPPYVPTFKSRRLPVWMMLRRL